MTAVDQQYEDFLYSIVQMRQDNRTAEQHQRDREFWEYFDKNPSVLSHLVEMARRDLQRGLKRGFKDYFGLARWFHDEEIEETEGSDGFRLNDKFTSRYQRVVVYLHPELISQFERRNGCSVRGFDPSRGGML